MFKLLAMVAVLAISTDAYCFTSLGDAKDKTALVLKNEGAISVNITDNSAKAGYLYLNTADQFRYGLELKGRVADGVSKLFDGKDFSPEAQVRLSIGYQPNKFSTEKDAKEKAPDAFITDQWHTLSVGYKRGEYNVFDSNAPFDTQINKKVQNSPLVDLYFNWLIKGMVLAGVSLDYTKSNNFDELKEVSLVDTNTVGSSGSVTRTTETKTTARKGDYKEFDEWSSNGDFMYVPGWFDHQLGIDIFYRASYDRVFHAKFSPGAGLFVLEKGKPSKIVAGLTAQKDPKENKLIVGLTAGYHF